MSDLTTSSQDIDDLAEGVPSTEDDLADSQIPGDDAESEPSGSDEDAQDVYDEADQSPPVVESPYDRPGQWFVAHTYAGYEQKVRGNLKNRIASMNMEDRIFECVIPMEDVVEFKNGKKVTVSKKVFPG